MEQTLSPNSLVDAEGDIDSHIEEASWPETDPAEMQETDSLCNRDAIDGNQTSGCVSQATESCLLEHPVALIASQTGENSDQAMDQALEPELSEASSTAVAMTSASDQEPEPEATQSPSTSHQVASANEPEGARNAQEDDIQPVARELGIGEACSAIEEQPTTNNESTADHQDDQGDGHVASTSLSERGSSTTTTSPIPHTASHLQHTINESVAHGNIDLPSSNSDDEEVSEMIIVDTNGGKAIVIDSTDEEMDMDDDKSRQTPRRRVQRKRVSPRSQEMIDWTSREYETTSAASLAAAWKMVWKQWGKVRAKSNRQLAQTLDRFHEKMSRMQRYELPSNHLLF
ncbi:hypothetical protein PMIN01_13502 [Paraphaeosphaeria minitans]|uniref:Uncharacterized protein n=1 Tax=Paraphaeosphaeria minitans TaxID=565426 RepID=A0A9P6G6J2_9PLEO|nr:hypothetical protein PMIN01_13502 [Paraphaeosphaeria minitans]